MTEGSYTRQFLSDLYKTLYTIRIFETTCIQLYRQGLIRGYLHPYLGEEAIATGVCAALRTRDYIVSTHRGHGHCIARGGDLGRMVAEIIGRQDGYCGGRGGSMHIADVEAGNLGANGVVGAGIPLGVGAALGARIRGEERVAVVFTSDGAVGQGTFGEAMNLAAAWDLPILLVIENNQYAVSTPVEQSNREVDLYKRGLGYGIESFAVDGNDVLEVYERTMSACERCRHGEGPVLMEAVTYRQSGHHVNDSAGYMPTETVEYYRQRDPLQRARAHLLKQGGATEDEIATLEGAADDRMDKAIKFARASPEPSLDAFLEETGLP